MRSNHAKMAYFQIMRLTFPRCKIIVTGKIVIHTEKNCQKKNKNMKISWKSAVLTALLSLIPWSSSAQVEKITDAVYRDHLKALPVLIKETGNPYLKNHLAALKPEVMQKKAFVTAVRVAADLKDRKDFSGQVIHYAVPAMSELMRLPEVYPLDGKALAPVRIVSAQDEYEPGSFQVYPLADLGKVEFKLSVFKNENGVEFPADRLDLKVIKVWYQNRNAWWSYFADTELKLVPELLLNDEDLIKVDTERVQNYARITEKDGKTSYFWITPPTEIDRRFGIQAWYRESAFHCMTQNFRDAKTLQKVMLNRGEFKQFFLTVHTQKGQAPGLYSGSVFIIRDGVELGTIPVQIRVLPFVLPQPAAYGDVNKPFLVSSYNCVNLKMFNAQNGFDMELAKKQLYNVLENQVKHNQTMHWVPGSSSLYEHWLTLDIMRRCGMRMDYVMCGRPLRIGNTPMDTVQDAKIQSRLYRKALGPDAMIFLEYGDEPGVGWVRRNLNFFEIYQKEGLDFAIAGKDQVFFAAGHSYRFFNTSRAPEDPASTRLWNDVGKTWVGWYAMQHVGAENPAFNRRQNGMAPYLANYSALCNYAHYLGPYNDRSDTYKPMIFAYGCGDGVIDTLQWEGFREGVDDIRYATLLKRLALEAANSEELKIEYQGRAALQFFAEIDSTSADMNTVRLEMITRILQLKKLLNK